jgi:gliding motility-associated-like protein
MGKLLSIVLVLLLTQSCCYAQIDTEFWFAPPDMTAGHGDSPIYLRISAQDQPATVKVSQPAHGNQELISVTLEANTTQTINLSNLSTNIETIYPDAVMDTGLRITASAPITAYYEEGSTFNAEIFVLKGKNALGNHFIIPWQTVYDNSNAYVPTPFASFDVVATENNTVVTVYPTVPIYGHESDSVIRVKLNRGETYSFKKPSLLATSNPVGTVVKSTKPISITIKDDSVVKATCHDALGDQLVPVKVAGKEYIVPRGFLTSPEYLFIMATENNTDVFVSGINVPVRNLNEGEFYTMAITLPSIYIRANKPVFVLHVTGFGCELGMAVLPPITCTGSKRISFTRSTSEFFGMNILSRKEAIKSFKLIRNGLVLYIPPDAFTAVIGSDDKWYSAQLSYNIMEVPVNEATTIANDLFSFQAGIINGNAFTTCRYGYFSSYSTLFIGDDFAICEGNTAVMDAGPGKEMYLWSTGETSQSIDVADAGDYWVRVTREDCTLSDTLHMDVRTGHEDLGPDVELCPDETSNIDGGENFSWLWSDGTTEQYLRTKVLGKHWVNVVDDYGCEASDTIMVNEYSGVVDALVDVKLEHVSVDTSKQENINVAWTVIHPEKIPDNTVSIYKRISGDSQWEFTSSIDGGVHTYANPGNATSDNSYEFYVALADHCLTEQRQSLIHNSILLSGLADSVNDAVNLQWNAYIEWAKGVEKYEVWRKLDQDTVYSFVSFVNGAETKFYSPNGADGFIHNYLIRAIEKEGGNESWSNAVGMEFTHPIIVPNVFTPNGDGYNQYFFIPKIELYEDAELTVVDRWGKSVYKATGYKNDWDGDDLSTGVYYYVLDLKKRNTVIKGIVNIVK